ncbi:MAG: DUF5057 domain-containing protein, partial [Clostridia bacterium]|nr:DUF5057 domain-containing protein [Clostridia bacterium]
LATFIEFSGPKIVAEESSVVAYPDITTDRKISVKFTIQNPTGVGAANDRFKLNLYVDLDSDGKFKPAEMQQGLVVEEQLDNGAFVQIENNALKATTKSATYTYHVYKELPSDYAGLLPWKIEIIKLDKNNKWSVDGSDAIGSEVNYSNLHDSYQNYCYVRPEEASVINILQILPSDWDMTYRPSGNQGGNGNLYTGTVFESDTFKELIGENKNWFLVPKGDGDVSDTVYMMFGPTNEEGGMDDYSAYYHYYIEHGGKMMGYSGLVPDFFCILNCINVEDLNNEFDGGQDVQGYKKRKYNNNYLDKYNMVIMGFADSWGKGGRINNGTSWSTNVGLNMSAAFALQDYIDDGKALLLTHDTTTVYNNFPNNRILAAGINAANWIVDKISDALGAISGFLESIFGHNAASNGLSSGQAWLNRIQLNPDERERNGYWVNLLRDACGLDRYGVTYAIKEKAKTHDANLYSCKTENCRYKSYTAFTTCPKCGNKNVETTPVYSVTDKTLVNGYYTDEAEGHKDIIYGSGTTLTNDYPYDTSVNTMLANDYSIAYVPGSAVKQSNGTVTKSYDKYVGGYTRHTLTRYSEQASTAHVPTLTMYNSDNNTYDTTYITQTNKGQITCYPYDINIYKRDANGRRIIDENGGYMFDENGTMEVSSTHEQIYQLNMNGDDITCWYCMSGDEFADIPNDAVNTYYIYSRKNITYTGAGHTNTFTPEEAKLFANTLIAAYRPSTEPATAEFVSSENEYNNSYRKTGYILLTDDKQRDEDGDTTAEKIVNEEVHFRLNNKNLAKVGSTWASVDVTYSYVDKDGETQTGVIDTSNAPLYYGAKAEGETTENWSHLEKNGVYTFEVPAEVLNALKEEGVTEVTLVITPTTYLEGSDDAPGIADTVKVRLLGLSSLR